MRESIVRWSAAALLASAAALSAAQEAVRPEVGRPLQQAQDMIKAQRFKEALAKVREADNVSNKSANESFLVERMRLAAASGAGDADTAARSFEAISGSPKVTAADKLRMMESIAAGYYRAKDYAKATQWGNRYLKDGGSNAAIRTMIIQSQYLSGDFAGAAGELQQEITASEKAGTTPQEDRLKLLANAALKLNDTNTYVWAEEKLVTYYPKKDYWVDLLSRLQRKPNFSDRLALDTYRLSLATGAMTRAADYMEMAQLALQAGYPAEAKQVVDKGFAAGVLGTGAEGDRHKRLRDLVAKRLEEEKAGRAQARSEAESSKGGDALVDVGFNLVQNGQAAEGLPLMQKGIAKGGLKRPEDAKLHLGIAQLQAGENAKAQATFRGVTGNDGTGDLARLWGLHARRK